MTYTYDKATGYLRKQLTTKLEVARDIEEWLDKIEMSEEQREKAKIAIEARIEALEEIERILNLKL